MNLAGAVAIVPSFSGPDVHCRVCRNHGATVAYAFLPGLGELLWRECAHCRFGWYERIPACGASDPGNYL